MKHERENSRVYLMDCMELMAQYPDGYFDLAVVDPPYGIGISSNSFRQKQKSKGWDSEIPSDGYFQELFRVSKNQVIWGGNYFPLPPTQGFLIWDKKQPHDFSSAMCELAWMSIQSPAKIYRQHVVTAEPNKIHPTQKPVKLYEWIYMNYLPQGGKVLDTHLGSGSNRIAAHKMGNIEFYGYEIDKEYFDASVKRFDNYLSQPTLFELR
jgi:site-specific DNA-methyltransferase (adenine-specific)